LVQSGKSTDRRGGEVTGPVGSLAKAIAACVVACCLLALAGAASAETRKLKIHFVHTGEKAEIIYKKDGKYVDSGLKQANRILRDFRRNEPTKMDPRLLDLVWEVYQLTGSKDYINVISGYRSPTTNNMLRSRGRGVAKNSQHTLGKAMDFFLTDVKLSKLREIGLKMGVGGVGFYPTSGSPFVHLDTGNVRHWPKMSRQELARIFPDGKTLHVPSDGKPMPRYEQALAEYKAKGRTSNITVASAAETKKRGFFDIFGGNSKDDQADDEGSTPEVAVASAPAEATAQPAETVASQTQTLETGVAQPAPPETAATRKPVPGSDVGIAADPVAPTQIPLPQSAPRELLNRENETVEVAQAQPDPEGADDEALAIENIPVPGRRPEYSIVAATPEPKPEEKVTVVAALTAAEIENLRKTAVPSSTLREPLSQVAAATKQSAAGNEMALVEQPEAKTAAADAVETLVSGSTAKPQDEFADEGAPVGPSRQTLELALASTGERSNEAARAIRDLIEAGSRGEATQSPDSSLAQGAIPVPQRNPLRGKGANAEAPVVASTQNIGRFALSGERTISAVSEIRAPGYSIGGGTGETVAAMFQPGAKPVIIGRFDPQASQSQPVLAVRAN
jgi:uncharacterized protein YcbK (DUF882 family)